MNRRLLTTGWNTYKNYIHKIVIGSYTGVPKNISYWRNEIFCNMLTYLLPLSIIALIPSVFMAWRNGLLVIGLADLTAFSLLILVTGLPGLRPGLRKYIFLCIFYSLAIVLLYYHGTVGAGMLFLLTLTVLTAIIYSPAAAYISASANTVICLVLGLLIYGKMNFPITVDYDLGTWIAVSSNLVLLGFICALTLSLLLKGLEATISESKKIEQQQSVFASIINSSHDAILSKTVTGEITSWNHGAEMVFGYSAPEIIGKNISMLVPEQLQNEEAEILERIVAGETVENYETERTRKDGKVIQVTLTISPIKNEQGVVTGASKISRDITERKEHELQTERAMELTLANKELDFQNKEKEKHAAELIITNKELAFQNSEKEKRALELIIANKELVVQNTEKEKRALELVIANKELAYQNAEKEKRAAELIIANKELAFQNAEKEKRALELIIANKELIVQNTEKEKRALELVIANKELAFQSAEKEKRALELVIANKELIHENTEKEKRATELSTANAELLTTEEQLKSVNNELEAFSYSVSHDLRAPLRAIHGYTQILKEDYGPQLNNDAQRVMDNIMKSAQKMGQLVDDLLAFSRLGRKELQEQHISMDSMVREVCTELRNQQPQRKIEFHINPLLPAQADNITIKQVWYNLIANAIKYTGQCEKAIIEIGSELKGPEIIYHVKDNGAGFDMQYVNKLFGVFQRLHSEEEFEGTGVGLAIVQRIILKHKGRVWAEGKANEGATFYFTLNK